MDLNFDEIYKYTVRAMKINQSHPSITRDKKWLMQFLITHGIFTTMFVLIINCVIQYDLRNNDFSSTCRNGVLCVVYFVVTFSYSIMLINQELLVELIDTIKKDYADAKEMPVDEQEVVLEYAIKSRYVSRQWFTISIVGFWLFPLKNFVLYGYYYYIDDFKLVPVYDMTYPTIIEENRDNIFVYITTYILSVYYGMYSGVMYTAFVPLGPVFMLHICGQLELIRRRVENLFIIHKPEEVNDKLKEIIRQLHFMEKTKLSFRVVYELTLKATTIILPIACYEVIEAFHKGEIRMEFLIFIVGGVLISSSPCYYSNLLMEKGEQVRLAVYCSGWEVSASRSARSTLLVILIRALQPIAIRTMFRTVCLDALTDLFQQSYGIFNLMNAMWE